MLEFAHRIRATARDTALLLAAASVIGQVHAEEKFTYMTNWYAQAEHGGFYQAVATGIYEKLGLDVTIRMGGPQVNILQLMAAGQADCIMGSSDLQMMTARAGGLPVVTVAAAFQKDPQVLIAHEDVKGFEDMKGKTILVAPNATGGFWPWLKETYGFSDAQVRPYTFNIQPFMADANIVQQGYLTSEPFAIQNAGVKANTFLFADYGYSSYAVTISCMDQTVAKRADAVAAFVRGSMKGWESYLADPAPGNALIKKDNPNISDEQLAYSLSKIKEMELVTSGYAASNGIGSIDPARAQNNYDFLVRNKLIEPARLQVADAYKLDFIETVKVLP